MAFQCPHCPRTFQTPQGLGGHVRQRHSSAGSSASSAHELSSASSAGGGPTPAGDPVKAAENRVRLERAQLELERLEEERDAQAHNDLMTEIAAKLERLRREAIQRVKDLVVGPWWSPRGSISPEVRAQVLDAIETKLSALPVSELPLPELIKIAERARDEVLATQDRARAETDARRRQEEEPRRQAIAPPPQPAPPQPAPSPVTPAAAPASPLIAPPVTPAPSAEAEGGQARKKDALVQRGVDRVTQNLNVRDDLDLDTKAEIWDRVADQLEERLTGTETPEEVKEIADEVLGEEFGDDEDAEEEEEPDDEEEEDD